MGLVILMLLITVVDTFSLGNQTMVDQVFFFFETALLILGVIAVSAKLIYEFIYFRLYYYGIELEHLVISRGLFFKTRSSVPLASLSDIYIERTPIDLVFFLYNLHFTTTSPTEHNPVEGLSYKNAFEFQNYLLALANTTVKPIDNEAAKEALNSSKVTRDPAFFDKSPANVDPPSRIPENLPDPLRPASAIQNKIIKNNPPVLVSTSEKTELKVEKLPAKEIPATDTLASNNRIIDELHQTQEELKKTREELTHTEEILGKTLETIEHPPK